MINFLHWYYIGVVFSPRDYVLFGNMVVMLLLPFLLISVQVIIIIRQTSFSSTYYPRESVVLTSYFHHILHPQGFLRWEGWHNLIQQTMNDVLRWAVNSQKLTSHGCTRGKLLWADNLKLVHFSRMYHVYCLMPLDIQTMIDVLRWVGLQKGESF